jgi:hypothetical protein
LLPPPPPTRKIRKIRGKVPFFGRKSHSFFTKKPQKKSRKNTIFKKAPFFLSKYRPFSEKPPKKEYTKGHFLGENRQNCQNFTKIAENFPGGAA